MQNQLKLFIQIYMKKISLGSKCEMKTEVDTGCVEHQYTNFGYNNLGMPKPNLK